MPLDLGPVGWGLLGGLLLLGYRRLEIINRDRSRGLVKIDKLDAADDKPDDKTDLYGAFRRHVLSNVAEPGAIPGGTATFSITDLLGATDPTSLVKQVVATLSAITAVTPGFEVDAIYQAPTTDATMPGPTATTNGAEGADKTASHQVFVRVRKARTQETLRTKLVDAPTASLAMRESGYWAAAYILSRDSTSPDWARWSEDSAVALADYDEAVEAAKHVAVQARKDDSPKLRDALALAPTSGLLLARLANTLELAGRPIEALDLHLRAVTRYPRYPEARYRLASSLANLAAESQKWHDTGLPDKRRLLGSLRECARTCGVDSELPTSAPDLTQANLLDIAERFRMGTAQLFRRRTVAVLALRRSERRYWAPMLLRRDRRRGRRRALETLEASGYVLRERLHGLVPSSPDPAHERSDIVAMAEEAEGWQTAYNLACYFAVRSTHTGVDDRTTAVELLERIFGKDTRGELTLEWVNRDPDLENLRHNPRFASFRGWLPSTAVAGANEES